MLSLFDFAISMAYHVLSAMKNNSVNLHSISKGVFKATREKALPPRSCFNCLKDMYRLFRMNVRRDVCKEKSLSSALHFAICPGMDSPEIKGRGRLKPINPRNLWVSSNQGQNNMQQTDIK